MEMLTQPQLPCPPGHHDVIPLLTMSVFWKQWWHCLPPNGARGQGGAGEWGDFALVSEWRK